MNHLTATSSEQNTKPTLDHSCDNPPDISQEKSTLKESSLIMVSDEDIEECPFWIGQYKNGPLSFQKLQDKSNCLSDFLKQANDIGLSMEGAFATVNTTSEPPTKLYMIPFDELLDLENPIGQPEHLENLKSLMPEQMGLYLSKEFNSTIFDEQIFLKLLESLLKAISLDKVYFYYTQDNYHSVLNLITHIKEKIDPSICHIKIIH